MTNRRALRNNGAAPLAVTAAALFASVSGGAAAAERILFIGNSFTYGAGSAVRYYASHTVTDLNREGVGGVPALFAAFARQAGLDYEVALETRAGSGLDFHVTERGALITRRPYDIVVAHGYSTLDADQPGNPAKLVATSKELADLLRAKNADVELHLMATWSRADQVYTTDGAWHGRPIDAMAIDVRAAYDAAAAAAGAEVIPVGEAWNRAMRTGVADSNPYDGIEPNKIDLWTYDHYHASTYGYYLEALVIFGHLTGRDPRSLGGHECSAFELGLSQAQARALQVVAFDELMRSGAVEPSPAADENRSAQRCALAAR